MNKNVNYPLIPSDTRCKNQLCRKPINIIHGYVHLYRTGKDDMDTERYEFFCNIQCHIEHERQELLINTRRSHYKIQYSEHSY